jgi:amino acid transporter
LFSYVEGLTIARARSGLAYCETRETFQHPTFEFICSSSPGVVIANTSSVGASLMVWIASGLLAWTGASSFAELGSAIPLNGGAQAYLAYSYGPLISYLFAWTAICALKPGMAFVKLKSLQV